MNTQKGFTLTEIMVAIGVVSALMINGYNFYSNAIAKAQANEAMTSAKLISDNLHEYYARFHQLPDSHQLAGPAVGGDGDTYTENGGQNDGPFAGPYLPKHGVTNGYVNTAKWVLGSPGNQGHVEIIFQLADVQAQIAGKKVQFWFQVTDNLSHIDYLGCLTDITGGNYDGEDNVMNVDVRSPILQECRVGLAQDVAAGDFSADGLIED